MIELKFEYDYVVGDTDEWLSDFTSENEAAQDAFDKFCERDGAEYYVGNDIPKWLATLHDDRDYQVDDLDDGEYGPVRWARNSKPTGLYHDGAPFCAVSYNEDNWLSRDIMVTLAHTAEFGDLLIVQNGTYLGSAVDVLSFNGDDDSDAFTWASGGASHADGSECDCDWLIESACMLYQNGGGQVADFTGRIAELDKDEDGHALCPVHGRALSFWGN